MFNKLFKGKVNKGSPKKRPINIQVMGPEGILYEGEIKEYPYREEVILTQSIEWFQDREPCYIHRSAVIHRMALAIEDFMVEKEGQSILWSDLPGDLQGYMDLGWGKRITKVARKA